MFKYILFFAALVAPCLLFSQQQAIHGKAAYDFLIDTEHYNADKESPLLIFLHGRSLSGKDLNRVKRYGVLYAKNRGVAIPSSLIVAPQTSGGWDPDKIKDVLDYVTTNYNVDKTKVYVCGMSMGGYGTMDFVGKYPGSVAAAVAICGGGTLKYAENLSRVPLWIQHGSADRAVPASESRKIYKAIKNVNPDAEARLTIIPGGTHGSVERLFHQTDLYEWMFQYQKKN
ncbi:dienelactone hydrolase family protein [Sphingobacterium allocomposti]|jgi:predicted peptidase|uniref:Dienelactone hydrolase family protein n=1 Tax=Sphingobacterium allocomposti TaxID=415956 RepID=A0A5S5DMR9_9SPHI|nr:dienelactone hydrolase family protein [Sphingobacterium composti Yoo et al. 2007 non Ten et al. 2007]TYP97217.1 dienelactone hydrolase family protein [Sphingobacterium composti Yoo et al. 2007 non Ten et al. 2007]HLS94620.1 dienelactone hydrolase family protein [Sphingobacterium sp.]